MQLDTEEQLVVLTALQKAVKARLDEVRADADVAMLASFESDSVLKKQLKLGGVKMGDYLVVLTGEDWAVTNVAALEEFALAYGFAKAERGIKPERMADAIAIVEQADPSLLYETAILNRDWKKLMTNTAGIATFLDSGEPVPGVELAPSRVKCTQVRGCKPDEVVPRVAALGGIDRLLLGQPDE